MRRFPPTLSLLAALALSLPLSAATKAAVSRAAQDKPTKPAAASSDKDKLTKSASASSGKDKLTKSAAARSDKDKTDTHAKSDKSDKSDKHDKTAIVDGQKKKKHSKQSKSESSDALADIQHERVDYWVAAFSKMHDYHKKIAAGFLRKPKYQDMIERKLRKHGMPPNLIYLAMEESAFNPDAGSRESAVGLWQLTPATARLYGLKVNKKVDERRNPEKETDAALRVLTHLHKRFGCWYLAAAAYDSGENRIARIMRKRFGRERGRDRDYYKIWDQIPGETRDYVPAIIALKRIGKDPAKYGF